ncbi:hypothetical protein [Lutibaculum baratangense]|uniref:Putative cytochrome c n=1 Tax=Lutibaculum baratangense AMV1 TaxID=631454 RepID=V4R4R3_9HYPH|nr:hypothetical protein [Lutibaculum baratangense]ESR26917.1 putative cytochrome c precursor [Lutibaculum baratangense AMV1]
MTLRSVLAGAALVAASASGAAAGGEVSVERGAYVAATSGCHDCHSGGFAESGGHVDPATALTGVPVGFRGPWGTTYPVNIRAYMAELSEDEWVARARDMKTRPPMPWFSLNIMEESDLRSFHRYVASLGPVGEPMPDYVAPGETPQTPVIDFVPKSPTM